MVMSQMSVATFALDTVAADDSDQAVTEQAVEETQPDADLTTAAVEKEPVAEESATETATEPEAAEPAAAEPEKTEPAAEPAKAEAKKAEPKKEEPKEEAFDQSKTVSGVTVRVKAAKGVFPAGSKLSVSKVSVPSAVDTEDAEKAYAFDISIIADGKKIQPDGNATVSFTTEEVAEYDTAVYHMDGGKAEELKVYESGDTANVTSCGFSTYVISFTGENPTTTTTYTMSEGQRASVVDIFATVFGQTYAQKYNTAGPYNVQISPAISGVTAERVGSGNDTWQITVDSDASITDGTTLTLTLEAPSSMGTDTINVSVATKEAPVVEGIELKDSLIATGEEQELIKTGATVTPSEAQTSLHYAVSDSETAYPTDAKDWKQNPSSITGTDEGTYYVWYRVYGGETWNPILPTLVGSVTISDKVLLVYDKNGGSGSMEQQEIHFNAETTLEDNGFTPPTDSEGVVEKFAGWSLDKNAKAGDEGVYAEGEAVAFKESQVDPELHVVKLYAVWQEYAHELNPPKALSLTYNGDEQELINDGSVVEGQGVMKYSVNEEGPFTQALPKGVTAGDYTVYYKIEGANGYADTKPQPIDNVSIDAKKVTATGFEAEDKLYDGNTDAELVMDGEHVKADIEDLVGDDDVYVESADASFEDAEVGNNKKVNVTNIVLGGADAANYELTSTTAETTASITHEHSWQSEAKEGVVTLTCSQEACPYHDNPIHIYLNAKDVSYDGNPHPAELDTSEIPEELKGQIDVRWKNDTTSQKVFYRKDGSSPEAIEPLEPAVYKGYTRVRYKDSTGKKVTVNLTKEFTISEKTVTIYGVTAEDKVYDGNNTATVNADDAVIEGLVPGDVVTVAVRTEGASNAGLFENEKAGNDKKVTWSTYVLGGADADKYVVSTDSQYEATASIFKKPVTFLWSIDGEEYDPEDPPVYDGKHHIVTALVNREDIVGEDVVGAHLTGTTEARNVAPFDYTAEVDRLVGKDKDNYKFDLDDETASLNWNLEKADLTIQANDVKLTYGDDPYDNGVTYTGLVASDKSRVNPDRPARGVINGALQFKYHVRGDKKTEYEAGSDASEFVDKGYVVDPKSSELSAANYNITLKVGTLTVNRKHVVFSWDKVNPSKIYDGEPLTVEATTNDIIDLDEDSVIVAYDPVGSNTATNVVDAQKTSAVIDDITTVVEKAKNYYVDEDSNAENTITITPRLVEVVWQYDGPYTYDGTTKSVSAIIKGAVTGQKLTPVTSGVLEAKDAGSYVAKVTDFEAVDPALKDNYELKSTDRSLTWMINKATVTVTANNQTIYTDQNIDKTAVSYAGFAGGDTEAVLTSKATVTSNYEPFGKAGKYTLKAGGAAAKNYEFKYVNGNLTVKEKAYLLLVKAQANGNNEANVLWARIPDADRYLVYYTPCGNEAFKLYKTVGKNCKYCKVTGLHKGGMYRYKIIAQKWVNGRYKNFAYSNTAHMVAGDVSGNFTNAKYINVNAKSLTLTKGQRFVIKTNITKVYNDKSLLNWSHGPKLSYMSSNPEVAAVSSNGVIVAKGKGTCKVYAYAANGIWKGITVTVK